MPSKNIIKIYIKDGFYHIYNRGVEKRDIFLDPQDYKVFLHYFKRYLLPPRQVQPDNTDNTIRLDRESNLYKEIKLLCYCLMPNHYHLMVKQLSERAIVEFMRRLSNAYTKYFNEKYERVGSLFQGRYRAALIDKEEYFIHLPYYIHRNPDELFTGDNDKDEKVKNYPYSSYGDYLGKYNTPWIYKEELKPYFLEAEESIESLGQSKKALGPITLE